MAKYFELEGCPICLEVEINCLPDIKMVHTIQKFNADLDRYPEEIKVWRRETGGLAPAIQVGADWYVGLGAIVAFTDRLDDIPDRNTFPLRIPAAIGGIS